MIKSLQTTSIEVLSLCLFRTCVSREWVVKPKRGQKGHWKDCCSKAPASPPNSISVRVRLVACQHYTVIIHKKIINNVEYD